MPKTMPLKLLPLFLSSAFAIPVIVIFSPHWLSMLQSSALQQLKTVFTGIFLEALPFMLAGVLLSSLVLLFVSEQWVRRLMPSNPFAGVLFAVLLGILLPICECGLIPVVRRLMRKGMPTYIAVTFMLSGPIINPIVFAATVMAFPGHPGMVAARFGLSFTIAVITGLLVYVFVKTNPLKRPVQHFSAPAPQTFNHHHRTWKTFFVHSGDELIDMGKYLIIGCLLTAAIQTFIYRDDLLAIGSGPVLSYAFMMSFAYVLSLCSTSDAFVASSFIHSFTAGPLISFLVLGPMLDFKGTLMLWSTFRLPFVIGIGVVIIVLVFIGSVLVNSMVP
ncbi:permease [Paenibacillus sp. P96]|uniref:Permease n=1 Tax=Paenibacillus zeirhizosphaerae TaxID=2987519 RepID=A0ABT9FRA6_9BACL|nr:permease [Paenibacillus sp. P96]MDP4097260.1 permease [Paenibacillus sp. P96]